MIRSDVAGGVRTLTLDRPDAGNALTVEMRDDLVREVREARQDPDTRCVLVRAEGESFCSGMDLRQSTVTKAGTPGFDPRSTAEALRVGVQTLVRELWELDKPVVAAVQGAAVGPGAHLALACDIVIVSPAARFMWSFAKWGLVVDAGGAYLLPRLVGLPRAKAMVLLGDGVRSGEDAVREGLAYRCVDDADAEARGIAERLAAGPTRSLGLSKQLLNRTFETDLATALELEGAYQSLATASADLVEGMAAFREKRDPTFTGK
jgi:2-(1,2-epoxy-1,2-dihydrophenyl)acetyl-CoA isomerase